MPGPPRKLTTSTLTRPLGGCGGDGGVGKGEAVGVVVGVAVAVAFGVGTAAWSKVVSGVWKTVAVVVSWVERTRLSAAGAASCSGSNKLQPRSVKRPAQQSKQRPIFFDTVIRNLAYPYFDLNARQKV